MLKTPKAQRNPDGPLAGARVLVVDDHVVTIGLIKDIAYAAGASAIYTARNGLEALEMLRTCQPHLIVTDWRMPQLDGVAFTEVVRKAALEPDPRVPDPETPILLL